MNMKNRIRKISGIIRKFESDRDGLTRDMHLILDTISKKKVSLTRITNYKKEYEFSEGGKVINQVPALFRNNQLFIARLNKVIDVEEMAIKSEELRKSKYEMMIITLERKIKMLNILIDKYHHHLDLYNENQSMLADDENVINKAVRELYE